MPTKLVLFHKYLMFYKCESMQLNLNWIKIRRKKLCDAFDMFVCFHSPESLDLYGVKSGILPSETKGKTKIKPT